MADFQTAMLIHMPLQVDTALIAVIFGFVLVPNTQQEIPDLGVAAFGGCFFGGSSSELLESELELSAFFGGWILVPAGFTTGFVPF